ncbi:hypothetical protein FQA39_LY04614 [Lamprigera yunnana]|nr:hypothetical protein FQA39_LY04614 [Lamprigera yunnana]
MISTYIRKSERKLIFTQKILDQARRRIQNGESQRKVTASLGTKESTLRSRLKLTTLNDVLDESDTSTSEDECKEREYDTESEQSDIEDNVTHENESSDSENEISYWHRNHNFE